MPDWGKNVDRTLHYVSLFQSTAEILLFKYELLPYPFNFTMCKSKLTLTNDSFFAFFRTLHDHVIVLLKWRQIFTNYACTKVAYNFPQLRRSLF